MKPILLIGLLAAAPATVAAQDVGQARDEIEEVIVLAHPLSAEGLAQALDLIGRPSPDGGYLLHWSGSLHDQITE